MAKPVGRPKDKDPRKPIAARLRTSVIKKLKQVAFEQKRSIAVMIEIAVEEKYFAE
jgi:hypothetical protein